MFTTVGPIMYVYYCRTYCECLFSTVGPIANAQRMHETKKLRKSQKEKGQGKRMRKNDKRDLHLTKEPYI